MTLSLRALFGNKSLIALATLAVVVGIRPERVGLALTVVSPSLSGIMCDGRKIDQWLAFSCGTV